MVAPRLVWFAVAVGLAATPARAAEAPAAASFALVVGSNAPGPGQAQLRYAERDAAAVASVLRDVGGTPAANIVTALHPDRAGLAAAIASLRQRLADLAARGQQAQLVFYYSGHARADALTLGGEDVPLAELRQQILALPSTLTIVVIDACQSGAFSRIKGAEATTDFSFNSVARLNTAGLAVMASSSATELSQESDELASSYFTHHLLLALRGAGDANGDGKVSLDEAYRYTYNRTLAGTAATAVGAQHATLETELKGKGDVVLTRPASASSQLLVPAPIEGRLLIQQRASGSVLVELDKARGGAVRLAMASGGYDVVVRRGDEIRECEVTVPAQSTVTFDLSTCRPAHLDPGAAKGDGLPRWSVELGFGVIDGRRDGYVRTMREFGFDEYGGNVWLGLSHQVSLTGVRALGRYVALTLSLLELDAQDHTRDGGADPTTAHFGWSTYGLGAGVRAQLPLRRDHVIPYAQLSAGPAFAVTTWTDSGGTTRDTFFGYHLGALAGVAIMPRPTLGGFAQLGDSVAPVITNRFGATHDGGGRSFQLGVRWAF
ncbi:MAG TPA: caspase family protein [Polyangia bacterium]|nr:caspase family protein [Polyangia bacterium]